LDGVYSASSAPLTGRCFWARTLDLTGAKELWKTKAQPSRAGQVFLLVAAPQVMCPDRSRCLWSQALMPVLSALSTLKPSTICSARGMYACIFSNDTKSGVVVSWEPCASRRCPSLTSRASGLDLVARCLEASAKAGTSGLRLIDSLVMLLVGWMLWKERNS
jgi:hypothetical protein